MTDAGTRAGRNGAVKAAGSRPPQVAPFPVPAQNGHTADAAPDGEQEIELVCVRLWPVAKVTSFYGAATVAVWLSALAIAWVVATSLGLTHSFESFMRDIGFEGFQLDARPVFIAIGLLGLAWIVSVLVLALLAAASYNAFASLFGGFRYIVRPRQPTRRQLASSKANGSAATNGDASTSSTASTTTS